MEIKDLIYVWPIFATVVAVIWYLSWKASKWHSELSGLMAWSKEGIQEFRDLKDWRGEVSGCLARIESSLAQLLQKFPGAMAESTSPLKLNAMGKRISKELKVRDWARTNAAQIRPQVSDMSNYDIQDFCFQYVTIDKFDLPKQRQIKDIAYNEGVPLVDVLEIAKIELRDELLETGESA